MPALIVPTTQHTRTMARRTRTARITTTPSSCCTSDDEDAITPCSSPPPEPQSPADAEQQPPSLADSRKSSTLSAQHDRHFDPTSGEDMDDEQLWRRMLAIQRAFHCYNSARMSAALLELEEGVDVGSFVPSRSCLDLLNESIDLADDARKELAGWLHDNCSKRKRSSLSWRGFHASHAASL